ncbi:hypothetical protein SXM_0960 [Shewanella xiamenensis]|nr:hypothetical protein SXM_0960 [Shewanella xiamenensis]
MSRQDMFQASLSGKYITALAGKTWHTHAKTPICYLSLNTPKKAIQRLMDDGN